MMCSFLGVLTSEFSLQRSHTRFLNECATERIDEAYTKPNTATSMEETRNNAMPVQRLAELQKEIERLSMEKNQYLDTLSNSDILKLQLRETRKDAKLLSKQRKKLQAMADIEGANDEVILHCYVQVFLDGDKKYKRY